MLNCLPAEMRGRGFESLLLRTKVPTIIRGLFYNLCFTFIVKPMEAFIKAFQKIVISTFCILDL